MQRLSALIVFIYIAVLPWALHAEADCNAIDWKSMDVAQLEKLGSCFSEKLRTLPEAEIVFGPIKIEQEWRGIPQMKNPNFGFVQFEVESKGKVKKIDGLSLGVTTPFSLSLKTLTEAFGKYERLPQFPHYDSSIPYLFKLKRLGQTIMILDANYRSQGDAILVEEIHIRRQ